MRTCGLAALVCFCFLGIVGNSLPAADAEPTLPRGKRLEQRSPDSKLAKIVFIAGSNFYKPGEHEYIGGCAVLMDLVQQTPGTFPVLALDWPKQPETLTDAKAVVLFRDGGDKHAVIDPARRKQLDQLAQAGAGLVFLHQGVDVPNDLGDAMRDWTGGAFEKGYSKRAHWVTSFETFGEHPILHGVTPFRIDDGWLYRLRFVEGMKGVSPLLRTTSPKDPPPAQPGIDDVVSWAYERPSGGRSFAFTGCHLHASFGEEGYRRMLTNAILWTARFEVPKTGAPVALEAGELPTYLSPPPPKK
jgi:hypothetical protein